MQAVMKIAPGVGNVTLGTVDVPIVTPGHVIIEVAYTGICGTDLHIYHDEFRTVPPVVMGHEIAGRIVEVGAHVHDIHVGMRVTSTLSALSQWTSQFVPATQIYWFSGQWGVYALCTGPRRQYPSNPCQCQ